MAIERAQGSEPPRPVFEGFAELSPPPPRVQLAPPMGGPRPQTPQQILYFYSDDDWEEFTREWVLAMGQPYVRVIRQGGAGDKGADIAACLTAQGTAGPWHCFQCKHYQDALLPSDARPEMVKIFAAAVQGSYVLPESYIFVAPKIGPTLARMLINPPKLKADFLKYWDKPGDSLGGHLDAGVRAGVDALARADDFSRFQAPDLDQILKWHSSTPQHSDRFSKPLKDRPAVEAPPPEARPEEAAYVRKLLDVYNETYGCAMTTLREAYDHAMAGPMMRWHREVFYHAESLRVFARDSVLQGTYEAIESDIFHSVFGVAQRNHSTGQDRLDAVQAAAASASLTAANVLTPIVTAPDRQGLCHQLANNGRLTWCKEDRQ